MSDPFDLPSVGQQLAEPIKLLARIADFLINILRPNPPSAHRNPVKIVCISDTHTQIPSSPIPDGDILIHAGDLTNAGTPSELQAQIDWLHALPHRHKLAIAGNHDTHLDARSRRTLPQREQDAAVDWKSVTYLQDGAATLAVALPQGRERRVTVYGAPHIPACGGPEFAFQYPREDGATVWSGRLPAEVDVLVTHSPPRFHLDLTGGAAMGDAALLQEVRRVKPLLHVFGHVHAGRSDVLSKMRGGREAVRWDIGTEVWFERVLSRTETVRGWRKLLDLESWWCLTMMMTTGILAIISERLWKTTTPKTLMVNAALTYRNTGQLLNPVQVVGI